MATEILDAAVDADEGDRRERLRARAATLGILRAMPAKPVTAAQRRRVIASTRDIGPVLDQLLAEERERVIAYLDSSVLARAYLADERGHGDAVAILADPDLGLITGTWSRIEVSGVLVRGAPAAVTRGASSPCSTRILQPKVLSQ